MESAENQEQPISSIEPEDNQDNNEPSLSKIETIALLNDSIDRLEQTIKGISENSASIPSSGSINTLLNATQELADAVTPNSEINTSEIATSEVPSSEVSSSTAAKTTAAAIADTKDSVEQEQQPPVTEIKQKRNLPLIAIAVAAIVMIIVAVFWLWLPRQQASLSLSPEITTEVADNLESFKDQDTLPTPLIDPPVPRDTSDKINLTDSTVDLESINSDLEEPMEVLIPDNLESPGRAKNLKIVTIKPKIDLTPEQTLISAIKTKVGKLIHDYPAELIDSAKIDLSQNSLRVNMTDEWYKLSESRQNKIGNEMLKRSRQFSFHHLELQDPRGALVARNPVIGDEIIILQNSQDQ